MKLTDTAERCVERISPIPVAAGCIHSNVIGAFKYVAIGTGVGDHCCILDNGIEVTEVLCVALHNNTNNIGSVTVIIVPPGLVKSLSNQH